MTQPISMDLQLLFENVPKGCEQWLIAAELYSRAGEHFKRSGLDTRAEKCFKSSADIYKNIAMSLEENIS